MKKTGGISLPFLFAPDAYCVRHLRLLSPAAQAADARHRNEAQGAVDPLGVVVLVGHYDELPGPLEPLAGDLAQQP